MDTGKKDNPGQGEDLGQGNGGNSKTTIIVNTREKVVEGKVVTYDQIISRIPRRPRSQRGGHASGRWVSSRQKGDDFRCHCH
jgi:hypothetical protein